jgi:hypothetical protein
LFAVKVICPLVGLKVKELLQSRGLVVRLYIVLEKDIGLGVVGQAATVADAVRG